jgi:hypothetical protein
VVVVVVAAVEEYVAVVVVAVGTRLSERLVSWAPLEWWVL